MSKAKRIGKRLDPRGRSVDFGKGLIAVFEYDGPDNVEKAIRLDNQLIPVFMFAPEMFRLLRLAEDELQGLAEFLEGRIFGTWESTTRKLTKLLDQIETEIEGDS